MVGLSHVIVMLCYMCSLTTICEVSNHLIKEKSWHQAYSFILSAVCIIRCTVCMCVATDTIAQLIPDEGTPMHARVKQYRELLDGLPMDAYTHGCILHPELTTDSMIPKYATAEIRSKWGHSSVLHCRLIFFFLINKGILFKWRADLSVTISCMKCSKSD